MLHVDFILFLIKKSSRYINKTYIIRIHIVVFTPVDRGRAVCGTVYEHSPPSVGCGVPERCYDQRQTQKLSKLIWGVGGVVQSILKRQVCTRHHLQLVNHLAPSLANSSRQQ